MTAKLMKPTLSATGCIVYILNFLVVNILHTPASNNGIHALPITSKPIESTVENLAWQAWQLLPPDQKSLEKTRKVTPKSIFTLPLRDCPPGYKQLEINCGNNCAPGHHKQSRCVKDCPIGYKEENERCILQCERGYTLHNFNCIAEFKINLSDLLNKEIDQLIGYNENIYDYEDDESGNAAASVDIGNNNGGSAQLPSQDEPLRINLFEQKFPTDYLDNNNQTMFEETMYINFTSTKIQIPKGPENSTNNNVDNLNSTKFIQVNGTNIFPDVGIETTTKASSLGTIDAISLPATDHEQNKVILIKDDSSMQIISTVITRVQSENNTMETNDLQQLLQEDQFLPLNNASILLKSHNKGSPTNVPTEDYPTERTVSFALEEVGGGDTTRKSQVIEEFLTVPTEKILSNIGLGTNHGKLVSDRSKVLESEKKTEHVRSVVSTSVAGMREQENDFTTTNEPDSTTNMQVDETTIIEAFASPTIILHDTDQHTNSSPTQDTTLQQQFVQDKMHVVLKKSKVERVGERKVYTNLQTTLAATAVPNIIITTTVVPAIPTTATTKTNANANKPLSKVKASKLKQQIQRQQEDRFYYQHLQAPTPTKEDSGKRNHSQHQQQQHNQEKPHLLDEKNIIDRRSSNELVNVATTGSTNAVTTLPIQTTTTNIDGGNKPAQISVADELRIINELVKGKRKLFTTTTTASPKTMAVQSTTDNLSESNKFATTAESSLTSDTKIVYTSAGDNGPITTTTETASTTLITTTKAISTSASTYVDVIPTATSIVSTNDQSAIHTPSSTTTLSLLANAMPVLSSQDTTFPTTPLTLLASDDDLIKNETITTPTADLVYQLRNIAAISAVWPAETRTTANSSSNGNIIRTSSTNSTRSLRNSKIIRLDENNQNNKNHNKKNRPVDKKVELPPVIAGITMPTTSTSATPRSYKNEDELADAKAGGDGDGDADGDGGGNGSAIITAATTSSTTEENANFEAFWWLPIGWQLDSTPKTTNDDKPFYLRFWPSFSDSSSASSGSSNAASTK